jgi:hypothetical protein
MARKLKNDSSYGQALNENPALSDEIRKILLQF